MLHFRDCLGLFFKYYFSFHLNQLSEMAWPTNTPALVCSYSLSKNCSLSPRGYGILPCLLLILAHALATGNKSKSKIRKEQIYFSSQGVFDTLCSLWGFMILRVGIRKNAGRGTPRCLCLVELSLVCFSLVLHVDLLHTICCLL